MKYLSLLLALLLSPLFMLSQNEGTTLEEYRYLNKGLAYQIEMGLDATKEGYEIRSLYASNNQVEFIGFYHISSEQLKGITAILNPQSADPSFLGIPSIGAKAVVLDMYYEQKNALSQSQLRQLDAAQREWQFAQLGTQPIHQEVVNRRQVPVISNNDFTSKGLPEEIIPEEYNKPAVELKKAIPLANQKMRPAKYNMTGAISSRNIITAPVIEDQLYSKSKVAVKVCVDKQGKVHYARYTMKGSTTLNSELKEVATQSAKAIQFAKSSTKEECGVVMFEF